MILVLFFFFVRSCVAFEVLDLQGNALPNEFDLSITILLYSQLADCEVDVTTQPCWGEAVSSGNVYHSFYPGSRQVHYSISEVK